MRVIFKLFVVLLILAGIAIAYGYQQYQQLLSTPITSNQKTFTIEPGSNLQQVSKQLQQQGLSDLPPEYLYWYGRYHQQAHLIKAGEYILPDGATLPELLSLFIAGTVKQYAFTIIEGTTTQQLLSAIAADERFSDSISRKA